MLILIYAILLLNIFILVLILMIRLGNPLYYKKRGTVAGYPKISILVAARNEEKLILNCLKSLNELSYSRNYYEVLIGDDDSIDNTYQLVKEYIADKPNFKLYSAKEYESNTKAKARVLSFLESKATGEVLFITDADMVLPKDWIQYMLSGFKKNTGIVNGFSVPDSVSLPGRMQAIDWLYSMSLIQLVSDLGRPVTAIGNNMAVLRKAYQDVGGYEKIPFSIIEDFELFKAVKKKGYNVKNILSYRVLAYTQPIYSFTGLLQQRKRWMRGAIQLPKWLVLILFIQGIYYTALLASLFFNDHKITIAFFIPKMLLEAFFILYTLYKIRKINWIYWVPVWSIYNIILSQLMMFFYIIPIKTKWKGRTH